MIGHWFGNYRAVSVLGEGGMGAVYLAEHPGIGRRVAIKVLHEKLIRDGQHVRRFVNEARAANAIRHPNIVDILDSGTTEAGVPYLVMELLEGEYLADRLARTAARRSARRWTSPARPLRRCTPPTAQGNRPPRPQARQPVPGPRIHERTGSERVKVLDFGIAKLQTGSPADQVKTQTGMMLGTPTYMSPEQCRGIGPVGARSDIYALGVILYEMVCGAPPFRSEAWGELIIMHVKQAPAPPRARAPDLPTAVEAIILKALAKDPDDRFATMAELQAAIEAVAGSGTVSSAAWARPGAPVLQSTAVLPDRPPRAAGASTTMSESAGEKSAARLPRSHRKGRLGSWLFAAALAAIGGGEPVFPAAGQGRSAANQLDPCAAANRNPAPPARRRAGHRDAASRRPGHPRLRRHHARYHALSRELPRGRGGHRATP